MCIEKLRSYNYCKVMPRHGYWQLDRCVESYRNGGIPCLNPFKEPPSYLPAPLGSEFCPYVGCSEDFRHQRVDVTMNGGGNKIYKPHGPKVKYQQ
jgi:hypothetical protein